MSAERPGFWDELERPGPASVSVGGVPLGPGSRVRLWPRAGGGDLFARALAGRVGVVESLLQTLEDELQVVVVAEDDPGRDLGERRIPGHRFFFALDEVEPLGAAPEPAGARVLVAGIGNVFLGDDGFGVALAARLARRSLGAGVEVVDYGIRGMDLAYALSGYDTVLLLDAIPRDDAPGTLFVLEADVEPAPGHVPDAHGMDPATVLALAAAVGERVPRTLVVGCVPAHVPDPDGPDMCAELSAPVQAALEPAAALVESLLADIVTAVPATTTTREG